MFKVRHRSGPMGFAIRPCALAARLLRRGLELKRETPRPYDDAAERQYSREFKEEAVELASRADVTIKEVAHDLGIHRSVLERWCRAANTAGGEPFPGKASHEAKRSPGCGESLLG